MHRILLAGAHSGCGKTTVTIALLAALKARGLRAASFKCGPDYIDPMFHQKALGLPAFNLDPFFCAPDALRGLLARYAGADISVIEGAMGYYDGLTFTAQASTYAVARTTQAPVVLVADVKGVANSIGAVLKGFLEYMPKSQIKGVLFNRCQASIYGEFARIAKELGVQPLGFLPYCEHAAIQSRQLGLIAAGEITDIQQKLETLGCLAAQYINLDGILGLAASAPALQAPPLPMPRERRRVRIAVARDEVFCFLYQENLDLLEALGAELAFFSPLRDERLPEGIGGLYLPGGYPELHAEVLSANTPLLEEIRNSVQHGLPTIAECGGFLYLHDTLDGIPMAGVIPGAAYRTEKLQRFGYVTLTALHDTLLCEKGQSIPAHSFHYYESDNPGDGYAAHKAGREHSWPTAHATSTLYAGFPYLYFYGNPACAQQFIERAATYAATKMDQRNHPRG